MTHETTLQCINNYQQTCNCDIIDNILIVGMIWLGLLNCELTAKNPSIITKHLISTYNICFILYGIGKTQWISVLKLTIVEP